MGRLENALGQLKFVMPNSKAIYLHDTNEKMLFKRDFPEQGRCMESRVWIGIGHQPHLSNLFPDWRPAAR